MATLEELASCCANCLAKFECDGDRVRRISYFNENHKSQSAEGHVEEEHEECQASHPMELVEEDDGIAATTSFHHGGHLVQGQETLELSVVTLQESQETGELEVTGLERLEGVGVGVGGHHFQVDVEEAQQLIDSGVEVGSVNIIVDKKPFFEVLNAQNMEGIVPVDEQLPHTIEEPPKDVYRIIEEGVTVIEALSVIFGIPLEPVGTVDFAWNKDDPCSLCHKCAQVVTILYSAFQEFNSLSMETSYVSKGIKQFLNKINSLNRMSLHVTFQEDASTNEAHQSVIPSSSTSYARKSVPALKKKTSCGRKRYDPSIKRMKINDLKEEMISADIISDVSSDSNSLSDFETELIAAGNETVRKTRTSTRPRIAKKQSSDYEELESTEEEPEEPFDDDEEDDPNFDAEEELQDIKVSQEQVTLKRLTDICAGVLEYKEQDLQVDSEGKFVCPECNKAFKGVRTLNKHIVIHKLKTTPNCLKCNMAFETLEELHRHMTSAHNPSKLKRPVGRLRRRKGTRHEGSKNIVRKYTCLTCGEEFINKSLLIQHESEHGSVSCPTCNKEFPTPNLLLRHQKDVHEKKEIDYFCPECGEIFNSLEPLSIHFVENHNEHLNFCNQCGKSFHKSRFLLQHLKETHLIPLEDIKVVKLSDDEANNEDASEERNENNPLREPGERKKKSDPTPYKCSHCDKEYKRKKQLDIHILFHNGEEPQHTCNFCTKRFFQLKSLKRHLLLHTTDNPHVCEHCDRVFPRADHLQRHVAANHSDEKGISNKKTKKELKDPIEHKCNDCDKTFTRKEYLRLHQRIHTGEKPFMCSECGKTFRDPRNLAQHLVTHKTDRPFCCSICGLTFKRAHHLNDHEGTHREDVVRPFVCTLPNCGKAFKLKKHLISHELVHSGTKDHQCEVCGKAFNRKDNLRQHVNKVHGKESFSDLIRVPAEVHLAPGQQVQIQVQTPTLVPVTAITDNGNNTTTITTIQLPSQVFQAIPAFTYTHL